jgi:muramoyltetrapeptide carboxypeptidase
VSTLVHLRKRRQLIGALNAGALAGCNSIIEPRAQNVAASHALIKPKKLRAGQTIGLFAPGGFVTQAQVERSQDNMRSLGFKVKLAPNIFARWGGYAGTVPERVQSLHQLYFDSDVAALWAVRGGSGTLGLLPLLDYAQMGATPKPVIGYSDISALHLALLSQAGLVSFHGPVASSTLSEFTTASFKSVLMQGLNEQSLRLAPEHSARAKLEPAFEYAQLQPGVGVGKLIGGNLSTLASLIGSKYLPNLDRSIVFLEDIAEAPYRIDRLLHQLFNQYPVNRLAGVALGIFTKSDPPDADPSLSLRQVLEFHLNDASTPSAYGFSFGHIAPQWTLPLGINARLDTINQSVTLLEPAVTD